MSQANHPSTSIAKETWLAIAILIIVVILGAILRLDDLTSQTIAHIEIYVPGIDLPETISDPSPRQTFVQSITGPLWDWEPHPPGYYVVMFPWTRLLGTDSFVLRLPSVIMGVASILLIFAVGKISNGIWTGLLAAGMMAFNGYHIYWSQIAKNTNMACFLGLLSTLILLWMVKSGSRGKIWQVSYLGVTIAGLATTVFFWPILVTHLIWIVVINWFQKRGLPDLLRLQFLALILAGPLLAYSVFQSRRVTYLDRGLVPSVSKQLLEFGFLFDADDLWFTSTEAIPAGVSFVFMGAALLLLLIGLTQKRNYKITTTSGKGPSLIILVAATIVAMLFIFLFARYVGPGDPDQARIVYAISVVPLIILLVYFLLQRYWSSLQTVTIFRNLMFERVSDALSLNSLLVIIPLLMLATISLIQPIFAARNLLSYTPYLLIAVSTGVFFLIRRDRRWLLLIGLLVVAHGISVFHFKQIPYSPTDYKALAEQWKPLIEDSDLIFLQRHWVTTPIFYYLKEDEYHIVAENYSEEAQNNSESRIWVLSFEGLDNPDTLKQALIDYKPIQNQEALGIKVELFSPQGVHN